MKNESTVQTEIRCALSERGCKVIRQQSGKFLSMDGKRIVTVGIPGMSDLLVVLPGGRCGWVETKASKGGIHRKEQENFIAQMIKQGCKAGFAKSVEEALEIIK